MTKTEQALLLSDVDSIEEWARELLSAIDTSCGECGAVYKGRSRETPMWEIQDRTQKLKGRLREMFATMERAKNPEPF